MNDESRPIDSVAKAVPAVQAAVVSPVAEFSRWLDAELALLVTHWAHAAAPIAASSADQWGRARGANLP